MVLLGLVMELQCILFNLLTKLQKNPLLSKLAKLLSMLGPFVHDTVNLWALFEEVQHFPNKHIHL